MTVTNCGINNYIIHFYVYLTDKLNGTKSKNVVFLSIQKILQEDLP